MAIMAMVLTKPADFRMLPEFGSGFTVVVLSNGKVVDFNADLTVMAGVSIPA